MFKEEKDAERSHSRPFSERFSAGFPTGSVEDGMLPFRTMNRDKILLIEDEPDIAEVLQYNLEKEGFDVEWMMLKSEGLASSSPALATPEPAGPSLG